MMDLVDKGMRYFTAKKDYKLPVEKILNTLSNDDNFIDKVSDMVEAKKGIDNTTADKIVKLPNVQNLISKNVGDLDKTELENQLKTIFLKSWADKSITDRAIEKVKKDIK